MNPSPFRARQIGAKTHEVVAYHRDEEKPGKPLHLLVPGGVLALAALALIILIAHQTWIEASLAPRTGTLLIGLLAPVYAGSVFLFSYGYELYNLPRALRLTAIIVFVTLFAVVILAVLFFLLGELGGGSRSSKSRARETSTPPADSSAPGGRSISYGGYPGPGVFIGGFGPRRVETREVTREVVKEVPREPTPITCPFCGRSYTPARQNYTCPSCGAPAPQEQIEETRHPKASRESS